MQEETKVNPVHTPPQTPKKRTKVEVIHEYKEVASLVGDKEYRKKLLEVELETLYKKMYELNQEHQQATDISSLPQVSPKSDTQATA